MKFTFHDLDIVTRTVYGESRGESYAGKTAVAWTIVNRAIKRKLSPSEAALQPYQYSCWNEGDPNAATLKDSSVDMSSKDWRECFKAALAVLGGFDLVGCKVDDLTKGATHYHTQSIKPYWAQGKEPSYIEGNHIFYNNID